MSNLVSAFASASQALDTLQQALSVVQTNVANASTPGYAGTFDVPGILVLQRYGVTQAIATGYTLVLHVALWCRLRRWAPGTCSASK